MLVPERVHPTRNLRAVMTLFFVAPFVAEYLLGDLPMKLLPVMIVLAPMYGGGAVLIREMARRMGRGWPTMLMLGMAYTVVEEGLVTQSLFNPDYLKMHMHLLQPAYIPALGMGGWWTLFMFNLHTFWSISVSIALVESLWPQQRSSVWIGRAGDCVVAAVFLLGLAANTAIGFKQNHFTASHPQLLCAGVTCAILTVLAFLLPPSGDRRVDAAALNPWATGGIAFAFGAGVLLTPPSWGWGAVGAIAALDAVFLVLLAWLSRSAEWTSLHTLSVAAAGAIAYGVHAIFQKPLVPGSVVIARVGNAVFLLLAIALIVAAAKRSAQAFSSRPDTPI